MIAVPPRGTKGRSVHLHITVLKPWTDLPVTNPLSSASSMQFLGKNLDLPGSVTHLLPAPPPHPSQSLAYSRHSVIVEGMKETSFSSDNIYWLMYMDKYFFTMTKEVRHGQTFSIHTTFPDLNGPICIPQAWVLKLIAMPPRTGCFEWHCPFWKEKALPGKTYVFGVETGGIWESQYNRN